MPENQDIPQSSVMTVPTGVGSAVGVSKTKWYVARMARNNIEKSTAERLSKQGYECYVATQPEYRVWKNGRRKKIDRVVIPSFVFIHCTEEERLEIVHDSGISRFLTDRASSQSASGTRKVVTIPDGQINQLKFMLGQSDIPVEFVETNYKPGDKVRVIRGPLIGLEGEVALLHSDKSILTFVIKDFGCARLTIDTTNLEPIK